MSASLFFLFVTQAQAADIYYYTATTADRAKVEGAVVAAGINWTCTSQRCDTQGPWPNPGVAACKALARLVGRITSYGHPENYLDEQQLAQCNSTDTLSGSALSSPSRHTLNRTVLPKDSSSAIAVQTMQRGIQGTVQLTARQPYVDFQAGLVLNEASYDTIKNEIGLFTGRGGTGSFAEVHYFPSDPNATHTIELEISSDTASTYLIWGQGRLERRLEAGTQTLRLALPPDGKSGWHGVTVGPMHDNSSSMRWTLRSAKISASR